MKQTGNEAIPPGKGLIYNSETDGKVIVWDSKSFKPATMIDKETTNKLFPLTEEEAFKRNEADQQVRENLSYYIGLADRYYQEGEIVRAERDELQKNYETVLFERDEAREKLAEGPYSIEYVESLRSQIKGLEESVAIWKQKYEALKQETENVADFFAKYERRVI